MTDLRHQKIEKVQQLIPPIEPYGSASGEVLVLGWGGTYGSIVTAVDHVREAGHRVAGQPHTSLCERVYKPEGDGVHAETEDVWGGMRLVPLDSGAADGL